MEMCECVCDEMLEPLHYKQPMAYVSVPLLLAAATVDGAATALVSQLASSDGPLCPTANCGQRMKILRYLMAPIPSLLIIGFMFEGGAVQPNTIQSLLHAIPSTIDLQQAFKSVPQPATASLYGVLCSGGIDAPTGFHTFAIDANLRQWLHWGDNTTSQVGEDWEAVVSKCSLHRLKPALVVYQIHSHQY